MTVEAVACTSEQTVLGEGVRWDGRRGELLRVDILAGRVYRDSVGPDGALHAVAEYGLSGTVGTVGAVAPVAGDDGWLLAAGHGFAYLSPAGSARWLADVAPTGTRMNDAACDPSGRFWAGTTVDTDETGAAALYRLGSDGSAECVLDGLTTANGPAWSPDGTTMYLVDSGPRTVSAFAFDPARGSIAARRVLVEVPPELGAPDGLTVDADGDLWVAVWGSGRVHRYSPDGTLRQVLHAPAAQTTCCAFGGRGLQRLYVTTATEHWTDEQRQADPAAGLVYRFDTDATGRPAEMFRPDASWWATVTSGSAG